MATRDLRGKPIVITGASSGIGRATAIECARAGMPVAVGARREDRLRALVDEITREGGRAIAVRVDVDRPEECAALVERAGAEFGGVYAVFANAGYGIDRPIGAMTDAEMRAIFETNFFGTLSTIRPALSRMLAARAGHVLICTSCVAKVGVPFHGAYSATKAAQDHIGRALRIELRGSGVDVSTVHPVATDTEFFDRPPGEGESMPAVVPRRFMQPPRRVARAVVRCLRRPRPEVWTSRTTRFAFALMTAFPRLGDWGMRQFASRRAAAGRPTAHDVTRA